MSSALIVNVFIVISLRLWLCPSVPAERFGHVVSGALSLEMLHNDASLSLCGWMRGERRQEMRREERKWDKEEDEVSKKNDLRGENEQRSEERWRWRAENEFYMSCVGALCYSALSLWPPNWLLTCCSALNKLPIKVIYWAACRWRLRLSHSVSPLWVCFVLW